jgi:hypothetical protein
LEFGLFVGWEFRMSGVRKEAVSAIWFRKTYPTEILLSFESVTPVHMLTGSLSALAGGIVGPET